MLSMQVFIYKKNPSGNLYNMANIVCESWKVEIKKVLLKLLSMSVVLGKYPRCSYTALESMNRQSDCSTLHSTFWLLVWEGTSIYKNQTSTSNTQNLQFHIKPGTPNCHHGFCHFLKSNWILNMDFDHGMERNLPIFILFKALERLLGWILVWPHF